MTAERASDPPSDPPIVVTVAPVAVNRDTAAKMLGMSVDSFEKYAQGELRLIRRGRLRLVPVSELVRWTEEHAALTLGQEL